MTRSWHEDLVWERRSTLYQLFTQAVVCSLPPNVRFVILLDSSLFFFFFNPPPCLLPLFLCHLSGTLCDTKENRGNKRTAKKKKKPSLDRGWKSANRWHAKKYAVIFSKYRSQCHAHPFSCAYKEFTHSQTQDPCMRIHAWTHTLSQGHPACVFASTHFHSRWRSLG